MGVEQLDVVFKSTAFGSIVFWFDGAVDDVETWGLIASHSGRLCSSSLLNLDWIKRIRPLFLHINQDALLVPLSSSPLQPYKIYRKDNCLAHCQNSVKHVSIRL